MNRIVLKNNSKEAFLSLFLLFVIFSSCTKKQEKPIVKNTTKKTEFQKILNSDLQQAYTFLDSLETAKNINAIKVLYKKARKQFKTAEPLLAFVDSENYNWLNQPNITKVDEDDYTDIKIKQPSGFQTLEEEIFADSINLKNIKYHAKLTSSRLKLLNKNTDISFLKPYHILWILRDGFIRVALTGITGFDSPVLENSLEEAITVYQSLQHYLDTSKDNFTNKELYNTWTKEINNTIQTLSNKEFKTFDRFNFIKNHTQQQLKLWNKTVKDWKVEFPFERAIMNNAESLFSKNTFNFSYFSPKKKYHQLDSSQVSLGKQLFFDNSLSKGNKMSCATCHKPEKAYTDGLKIAIDNSRNSPTLTYAAYQQAYFYDRRAGSLEGQIISVVNNEKEFHSSLHDLKTTIEKNPKYAEAFKKSYDDGVSDRNIRHAIASFIRTLNSFNSKFDNNINGKENSLTDSERNGFNLFMGKAKCATCHFPPVFNGTVPTAFKESEVEQIGVPAKNDTINATISADVGAYNLYKTEERKHFFKTPTVRNSSKTAPYMHNGVYSTLDEVIDFYNRGGGIGIGIDLPNQTLPFDNLKLNKQEIQDLVAFLNSLEDTKID